MLKDSEVVKEKNINKYLDMAISGLNEDIAIYIYEQKDNICTKQKNITNPYEIIKQIIPLNFYRLLKLIYKDYIVDNVSANDMEILEDIYNKISKKGELHLIEFLYETTPNIFNELYTDIVVDSIQKGFLDIFDYCAKVLNIKNIDNDDKLDLLEIALYTDNEDIFTIIYEIISPIDITHPHLKLMELAKKKNKKIFAFLYTEADNQIRGYNK